MVTERLIRGTTNEGGIIIDTPAKFVKKVKETSVKIIQIEKFVFEEVLEGTGNTTEKVLRVRYTINGEEKKTLMDLDTYLVMCEELKILEVEVFTSCGKYNTDEIDKKFFGK